MAAPARLCGWHNEKFDEETVPERVSVSPPPCRGEVQRVPCVSQSVYLSQERTRLSTYINYLKIQVNEGPILVILQ